MGKILSFPPAPDGAHQRSVGRVHPDGSITFQGRRYCTLKEVPAECRALHPDIETHRQWRALYRAIDPRWKPKPWREPLRPE